MWPVPLPLRRTSHLRLRPFNNVQKRRNFLWGRGGWHQKWGYLWTVGLCPGQRDAAVFPPRSIGAVNNAADPLGRAAVRRRRRAGTQGRWWRWWRYGSRVVVASPLARGRRRRRSLSGVVCCSFVSVRLTYSFKPQFHSDWNNTTRLVETRRKNVSSLLQHGGRTSDVDHLYSLVFELWAYTRL